MCAHFSFIVFKAVCKVVILFPFYKLGTIYFGNSPGFLGDEWMLSRTQPPPPGPLPAGRCFTLGDRISFITSLSLYPVYIKFYFLKTFWYIFAMTEWKLCSFLSHLVTFGTTYEIIFCWIYKIAPLMIFCKWVGVRVITPTNTPSHSCPPTV